MNIVIVGAGEVGQHLAGLLSREEHAVTVVDPDPSKSRKLTESLDVQALVGVGYGEWHSARSCDLASLAVATVGGLVTFAFRGSRS